MKHTHWLWLAAALLLLASCEHKELCFHHPHTVRVRVAFDWRDAPQADPDGMCVYFYPEEGGEGRRFDFSNTTGGEVELGVGRYRVVCYNNDTEIVEFSATGDFAAHGVFTREGNVLEPIYGNGANYAPRHAKAPVMMLGRGGADTLYLHASVARNAATPAPQEAQTRGVPVDSGNFKDVCRNFGVTAYTASGGKLFMLNELVDVVSGSTWTSAEKRYWPADGSALDFFAHAPAAVSGMETLGVSQNDRQTSFSYTVPQAATDQPDIMFAYTRCGRGGVNERGNVSLKFSHALAGVRFVAKDVARCTIKTITLKGLKGAGTCVCRYDEDGKAAYSWTLSGGAKDFSQEFNVSLENRTTGEQPITDVKPETTFMLIPQRLDGATVEITVEKDGKTTTLTGSLSIDGLTEWQAGCVYTYAISTESINWEYVFEVTPTVTFKLGELQKTYGVTSYRRRVDDPSMVEAVPWTALGKDSVEKEPQNEDKTEWKKWNGKTKTP